jgi:integrase
MSRAAIASAVSSTSAAELVTGLRFAAAWSHTGSRRCRSGRAISFSPHPRAGGPKAYRNVRRALELVGGELAIDLVSHDFRRSLASFLIIAARSDDAAVTGVMGHSNIEVIRRIYAADWRKAEERNAVVLRQVAAAGIGQW